MSQTGYVEGRNLLIEYRWAGNQVDRLPTLAADLVQLRVAAIVSPGLVGTLAAMREDEAHNVDEGTAWKTIHNEIRHAGIP